MDEDVVETNSVHGAELRQFVERVERLEDEKKEIGGQIKEVYAEAQGRGFAVRYIRAIVKLRKLKPSEREEDAAMMDLYLSALGMAKETPLFRSIEGMAVDVAARDAVLAAIKLLAPQNGEITLKVGSGPRVRIWRDDEGSVRVEDVLDAPPMRSASPSERGVDPSRPAADFPDCTADDAFLLGRQARSEDRPVISNPFPWDDRRRRRWDEGWREEDGGDGMGPD